MYTVYQCWNSTLVRTEKFGETTPTPATVSINVDVVNSIQKLSQIALDLQSGAGLKVPGDLNALSNANIMGNSTVGGDQSVAGNSTVNSQTVKGNSTVNSQTVKGNSTVNSQTVTGNLSVNGSQTINGSLSVGGVDFMSFYNDMKAVKRDVDVWRQAKRVL